MHCSFLIIALSIFNVALALPTSSDYISSSYVSAPKSVPVVTSGYVSASHIKKPSSGYISHKSTHKVEPSHKSGVIVSHPIGYVKSGSKVSTKPHLEGYGAHQPKIGVTSQGGIKLSAKPKIGTHLGLGTGLNFGLGASSKLNLGASSKLNLGASSKLNLGASSKLNLGAGSKIGVSKLPVLKTDSYKSSKPIVKPIVKPAPKPIKVTDSYI